MKDTFNIHAKFILTKQLDQTILDELTLQKPFCTPTQKRLLTRGYTGHRNINKNTKAQINK